MSDTKPSSPKQVTRRRLFQLLGAALLASSATAVTRIALAPDPKPARSTWKGKTRWIGHC